MESRAAVRSRLSVRGSRPRRTGGRASRTRQPVNLSDQDRPMDDDGWVVADEHERQRITLNRAADDDEYEDVTDDEHHGHVQSHRRRSVDAHSAGSSVRRNHVDETRGREGDRLVAAED